MKLSRRTMLKLAASGLWVPPALAADTTSSLSERKFLFIIAKGGWDTMRVFTPMPSGVGYDVGLEAHVAEANGITYVSSPIRPSVDTFFQNWGDRVCLLNGMEIPSISHDVCFKLLLTGRADQIVDDWGMILGANSARPDLLLPYLVFEGPTYARYYAHASVRLGDRGQLPGLLNGDIFNVSTELLNPLRSDVESVADAFLEAHTQAWQESTTCGQRAFLGSRYQRSLAAARQLAIEAQSLNLTVESTGCNRDLESDAAVVLDCMAAGLARVAMLQDYGDCEVNWDTHWNDSIQDTSFQTLFERLDRVMEMLEERTAPSGAPLSEEVTVVVISEMAKTPFLNYDGGREHWTYTSAMLIGSGVRGGQVIGQMSDEFIGTRVSLATGALDDGGDALSCTHLGATLLALGAVDAPDRFVDTVGPIEAALS